VLTDSLRAQLAARKQELLEFLRDEYSSRGHHRPPISPRTDGSPAPLSFSQERLWFLEQLEPGNAAYNICRASCLSGSLNVAALEASLSEIVRRHETLRSQINMVAGRPVQVALPASKIALPVIDLRSLTGTDRDEEVRRRSKAEAVRPFDFSVGLFLRAVLFRTGDDQHILVLTTHHIVSDAWSMGILTRELWAWYEAFAIARRSPFTDLSIQYRDYAIWQREWLQGDVLESQFSYWKRQLNDLTILNLPTDRTRPARQSFRGAMLPMILSESLTAAINDLSHRQGVTPFMTLLAAFQVLLYRYSGQDDVVVGSPVANRSRSELEPLIGFFVNTLVLRTDLSGNPTFKELLSRVRDVCLGAYSNQDLPFEKLVQELQPDRDQSRNPLFQIMFVLQNATRPLSDFAGIHTEPIEIDTGRSQCDLSLFLRERDGRLMGYFEFNTDLFDRSTIERMVGHFRTLLQGILAHTDQCISQTPMLTDAERHQLLFEWNNTDADFPKDKCLHELFEEQVEKTPDAIAVTFEGRRLTYRELNARANQLARRLQELGVGPDKLVGIGVERSLEMIVGVLGILKAGGAYVPLDPVYPRERLAFILEDAQVEVLLMQERLAEDRRWRIEDRNPRSSIPSASLRTGLDPRLKVVCVDRDWQEIARESDQNLSSGATAENLAYVIYTSGSTGQPKGVAMEHRALVNLVLWQSQALPFPAGIRVAQFAPLSFDVSFQEIFSTLCNGGTLILISDSSRRDPHAVFRFLNTEGIERLFLPPVMFQMLAGTASNQPYRTPNLKSIVTAGEQLRVTAQAAHWLESLEPCTVHNQYGPTETHVVTSFVLGGSPSDWPSLPPVGRPISNVKVFILDRSLRPVPIGVAGELYIGGASLARGYFNDARLTAERFFNHELGDGGATRLYKTGDQVRYRSDGSIEFVGRMDEQVKLRGYRVELGEIETILCQHPTIQDAAVMARGESIEDQQLTAYVVQKEGIALDRKALRRFLERKLPGYMVPSIWVRLESLPLSPSGKVDRRRLSAPDHLHSNSSRPFHEAMTEIEQLIAQAWGEVLSLENVLAHDDFFELGGHSLIAIQIMNRLRETFAAEIPLSTLFEAPTVASLAVRIEDLIKGGSEPHLPSLICAPRDAPLPVSWNQEQLWRIDQLFPRSGFFNMSYVYQLSGALNIEALEKSLSEIFRRHEALRTIFAEGHGAPMQIVNSLPEFRLPIVDLRTLPAGDMEHRAAELTLEEKTQSFDLSSGPLFVTKLVRLTEEHSLLLVTLHHMIADHWSMQLFCHELKLFYEAFTQGQSCSLGPLPMQFADFAYLERESLKTDFFQRQLAYWKNKLAEPLPMIEFNAEGKRRKRRSFRASRQPLELSEALFQGIKTLARKEQCTPFMVIVAAVNMAIYLYTGQPDIRIGTLAANRRRWESENTFGHFINTIIIRALLSPSMTCRQYLAEVKSVTLEAYVNQELPFEHLARVLAAERQMDRESLIQVFVDYQVISSGPVQWPGLVFAQLNFGLGSNRAASTLTMYDMILQLRESSTQLTGSVNYKINALRPRKVAIMMEGFQRILATMIASPGDVVSEVLARAKGVREKMDR